MNTNFQTIGILGCGWLGMPLAHHLVEQGFAVKGSTTSLQKASYLHTQSIAPYIIKCTPEVEGDRIDDFFSVDALFLNIPFKRDLEDPRMYAKQIDAVWRYVVKAGIKRVVFASSTSVYPGDIGAVCENDVFQPDSLRAQVLCDIEKKLLQSTSCEVTILRFAGLFGGERKVGRFLSGKVSPRHPDAVVNLVHLKDCIEVVEWCLKTKTTHTIFNVCGDAHPKRHDLYLKAAQTLGVESPVFNENATLTTKLILNDKIKSSSGITFKHSNPFDYLA